MIKTIFKSILLFISIPLINSIAFGIWSFIYNPKYSFRSQKTHESYENAMLFLIISVGISILIIELLYDKYKLNDSTANILYLGAFMIMAIFTHEQFIFRPLEHGLTFLSILSILLTRNFQNSKIFDGKFNF